MYKRFALILPLLFIVGCGEIEKTEQQPSVAAGEQHWKTSCASCHGVGAQGVPELGPNLIGSAFVSKASDDDLVEYIIVGRKADDPNSVMNLEMPAKGGNPMLKVHDMLSIVAYIRSIQ